MTTIRNFCCNDLLRISSANLDHFSVTTTVYLYMLWLAKFPNYSHVAIAPGNRMMGYLFGALKMNKEDLEEDNWHGLTIFLNIASDYRRQKLGTRLMRLFESQMVERRHSTKCVEVLQKKKKKKMATIRRFCCNDHLTDTGEMSLYLTWFATWPDYSHVAVAPGNRIIGYILGTTTEQYKDQLWQGIVMDVSVVSPRDRKYFVCLFVSASNTPARQLFEQLGYEVSREMPDFDEDTLDMMKELSVEDQD